MPRKPFRMFASCLSLALALACSSDHPEDRNPSTPTPQDASARSMTDDRKYLVDRVEDVGIVQVYADGFERLTTNDRLLCWHLYEAALAGRPIFIQQKCAEGPAIQTLCEEILTHASGLDPQSVEHVRHYMKLFWVNNGPYNAVTARKNLMPGTPERLLAAAQGAEKNGANLGKAEGETTEDLVLRLRPMLFDAGYKPMVTAKNPEGGQDIIQASAVNFYGPGVTLKDLEGLKEEYALNSTVVKQPTAAGAALREIPWRSGDPSAGKAPGLYAEEIGRIVSHLEAARPYATPATRKALDALIRWYRTGEDKDREAYDIAWVADKDSTVDTVNGFIEVYLDPRGKKGAWEGIVSYEDPKKAELIKKIAENAKWFEDHMPYDAAFKKENVTGISARSIDVVIETGDSGPVTPIGINLPNDQSVRETYGSKSVSLANIVEAYDKSASPAARSEFCWDEAEVERQVRLGSLTADLTTNMHEVIGHASGRQAPDKQGDPATWIREYYSALEEARADLVALWFIADPKLKELGLVDDPQEAARTEYESYTRNGAMTQLRRMKQGDQLEEDHMRNRQMVVGWIMANSNAIEKRTRDGKTYLVVSDVNAWREAAGRLLALVQRLKSTGDYDGTKKLFDAFGVKFDPKLRDEVIARYAQLDVPAYTGFLMPRLQPMKDAAGKTVDVKISYPLSIEQQMLEWSGRRKPPE